MPFELGKIGKDLAGIFTGVRPEDFSKIDLQESFFKQLLDYSIERGYLHEASEKISIPADLCGLQTKPVSWIQINRLPVNPSNSDDYDLLARWQSTLSALHAWGQKAVFLLLRNNGETNIFLGTESPVETVSGTQAAEQMRQAISSAMPGIDAEIIRNADVPEKVNKKLLNLNSAGAITGIPAFRGQAGAGIMQTLDPLAFGLQGKNGDKNFALVVIAEPINDDEISGIISQYRSTGNTVHNFVRQTVSTNESQSSSTGISIGIGAIIQHLLQFAGAAGIAGGMLALGGAGAVLPALKLYNNIAAGGPGGGGIGGGAFISRSYSNSISQGVNVEYLNRFAQYAEELIDKHIDRLKKGRNLGFWNTGTYILGQTDGDVNTVMGLLRSIYSGDESYIEPIRLHRLRKGTSAVSPADLVKVFQLIPLPVEIPVGDETGRWHPLGNCYQFLSTPLNTEELSLSTSLPRKDVPGLRFVKTVVRFANNPAKAETEDIISLGRIIDTGVVQKNTYDVDFNTLVKHTMIAGTTGMGKSTTCRRIIDGVLSHKVPVLILEPAKDEYVQWALEFNRKLDADAGLSGLEKERRRFRIFMPGVKELDGSPPEELQINPFEPAAMHGVPVDMMSRCEQLVTILNASLPVSDVLPIIIDEAVYTYLNSNYKEEFQSGEMAQKERYVKLDGLARIAAVVLKQRNYDKKVQDDLLAALNTRFEYLLRGKRGRILNVERSVDYDRFFSGNVVVNLSRITAQKDKALIMALLMLSLYEYRASRYSCDNAYRAKAKENKLMHMTVVEEAHNLLAAPRPDFGHSGDAQAISSELFSNILAEIRAYGEGIMVVDQVPTKLIPDAIKNTNYKIVHRLVAPDDAELMAAALSLRGDQRDLISSLGQGETIIFGDRDDAAAWVKIKK